jgi:hypothetical protein
MVPNYSVNRTLTRYAGSRRLPRALEPMEEILQITREAVCLADDFAGPLDMTVKLVSDASLGQIIEGVAGSDFLQFSSTHDAITAVSGRRQLARITSRHSIEYLVAPATPVKDCIAANRLDFRFRLDGL